MTRPQIDSIGFDGKTVTVWGFEPLEDCRHIYKHVLNLSQKWSVYFSFARNLGLLRRKLAALGCKGEEHGNLCADFDRCDGELKKLYPSYQNLIREAIRYGAFERNPRHTHQWKGHRRTSYFLSEKGVLAETYEESHALKVKTAYRHVTNFPRSPGDLDFVKAAKRKICYVTDIVRHSEERWCTGIRR